MDWTRRLEAAIEGIEENLDANIDLERIAGLANCSLFHFMRMFEVVCGISLGEYIRRRRLSRAALDLAARDEKVIDVALRYGYESPEAFSKAFHKMFGIRPSEARKEGTSLITWPPLGIAVVLKGEQSMKYKIVEKSSFKVKGLGLRTTSMEGKNMREIPAFWQECHRDGSVNALLAGLGPMGMFGICTDMGADEQFTYVVGVEDSTATIKLPAGKELKVRTIPSATYAVFESIGPMPHAIQEVWKRAYGEWFPSSGYEHAGSPDFEVYPPYEDSRGNPDSPDCVTEVWIPIKPKKS